MSNVSRVWAISALSLISGWSASAWSAAPSQQELRSLDDQVQEIKTDVLGIAGELTTLEERLLFPSTTEAAIFVALSREHPFRLDAVRILVDGQLAAHHIYSFKELDALQNGGVQRIYTGNLTGGEHQLEISVIGKLANGSDYRRSDQFSFTKDIGPRLLGIALAGPDAGRAPIELTDW